MIDKDCKSGYDGTIVNELGGTTLNFDVIIVGGGASGLVAAITSAKRGKSVLVLEHKDKIAKKILATGNGKCNFTNTYYDDEVYRSDNPSFVLPIMNQFSVEDTLRFFEELGIYPLDRDGYMYPNSGQAASILDVLVMEVNRLGVTMLCDTHVEMITKKRQFAVKTSNQTYYAPSVILCTGGKASEALGSDGSGYGLAKAFGHSIVPVVQALTALRSNKKVFKPMAGVRTNVFVTLYVNQNKEVTQAGELQLTDYGVSGIPIFQISRYATRALYEKKSVSLRIDFLPQFTFSEAITHFMNRKNANPAKTMEEFMIGLLNSKLSNALLKEAGFALEQTVSTLSVKEMKMLVSFIKGFEVPILEGNPFANSQVCAGGVNTEEISSQTMESKLVSGLFFAGEVVDVDGTCGGYNLQWAWSSGFVAGSHC